MFIIKKKQGKEYVATATYATPKQLKLLSNQTVQKVLIALKEAPDYPKSLAEKIKVHEQTLYYYMRRMESAGIISTFKKEQKGGIMATLYQVIDQAYISYSGNLQETQKSVLATNQSKFFTPFVENGQMNARIIVGSPDPHGPEKARSRDGYYGMDFALFLGTFLTTTKRLNVCLDTEITKLDKNLIILGGPIVNKATAKFNEYLPIQFKEGGIHSTITGKKYYSDETGLIAKISNPFAKDKWVLILAGTHFPGTRATILAFIQKFNEIEKGNNHAPKLLAKVVEGVDLNSDGIVDSVDILE